MRSAIAIIPAYNEASRIQPVIRAALGARTVQRVVVVDDGSIDNTARFARQVGAHSLQLNHNRGKGQAMLAGVRATTEPIVVFLDADLQGLLPEHIDRLVTLVAQDQCVMAMGLRDYGPRWNQLQTALPRITGERAVLRTVLEQIPGAFWNGFRVEAGMNAVASTMGPTCEFIMHGVSIVTKWEKENPHIGLLRTAKMTREVIIALYDAQKLKNR